ncbi:hypothetical protein CEQ21_21335 [Niallia circulans]|uniref:Uncharacterized protein n=1 Tax=Niallia circulans TaxID=1397 RepID=A0A553SLT9_NIACI|nr:hypothetical protein [Niallia circulans]TRZ37963.1 hypothetical protein CEQ21_21335 [Niallia circulans]
MGVNMIHKRGNEGDKLDSHFIFTQFLFYGILFAALFFAWKIGKYILKSKGIVFAAVGSILSSICFLMICGAVWYQAVPDLFTKGILLLIYILMLAAGNGLVIRLLLYKRSK